MRSSARILAVMGSLALVLAAWAISRANGSRVTSPSSGAAPAALTPILRDYNTAASKRLEKLEADFNAQRPSGVQPIVFLDYDKISTWFGLEDGPPTLSALAHAMNTLDAEGGVRQKSMSDNCLVVPQYPGISFHSAYAAPFRVRQTDLFSDKTIAIDLSTKQFEDFVIDLRLLPRKAGIKLPAFAGAARLSDAR